jgi:hypothetical protein
LHIAGIPVLPCNFWNSSLFTATCKNSPSARHVSAYNRVYKDADSKQFASLKYT